MKNGFNLNDINKTRKIADADEDEENKETGVSLPEKVYFPKESQAFGPS